MKKVTASIVYVLLLCTVVMSASAMKPKKTYSRVYNELSVLLAPSSSEAQLENATIVKVKIRINSNNQIVVLETNSLNEELNEYIMESLNYKKLATDELSTETDYVFDVNFQS
ncbi:hypothetical protein [Flavobacterium sp. 7A]|uniref:hypothetical protein n=1 Tax=Flavobacterium sp. 7A TaxID=2940571 RepID=UPI00222697BE|nr:hypothetical protein [Flavobacterium sp. 7A]MCW2121123.1 uncharacterized protein YpuA (DUF1002 family) [Flavobacterium sp. 7A]